MKEMQPGFVDPVTQAQACFRAVLDAMSHPGRIMPVDAIQPPAPLDSATAAVLLTLLDADTPVAIDTACAPAADWIAFHCGAPFAAQHEASFVLARAMPPLAALYRGDDAAPERSATLVLQVDALGQGSQYHLAGPGLRAPARLAVSGLPEDFAAQWAANHARFPVGIDMILCAGERLAALPRSLEIT